MFQMVQVLFSSLMYFSKDNLVLKKPLGYAYFLCETNFEVSLRGHKGAQRSQRKDV